MRRLRIPRNARVGRAPALGNEGGAGVEWCDGADGFPVKRLVAAIAIIVVLVAAVRLLPVYDWTTRFVETLQGAGFRGVAIFFAAYIAATLVFIPGALLTLVAGFVYGPLWGLALASPSSVAGATCAFLLGRTLLSGVLARRFERAPRVDAVRRALEHEGFTIVLLLRLSPVIPFAVLNYLLSLTRVRLSHYVGGSFLGMLPATAVYAYLGSIASTALDVAAGAESAGPWRIALSGAGAAATLAALVIVTRTARRALDDGLARAS